MLWTHTAVPALLAALMPLIYAAPLEPQTLTTTVQKSDGRLYRSNITVELDASTLSTVQAHVEGLKRGLVKRDEPSYLHFDSNLDADVRHQAQLHQAWQDSVTISSLTYGAVDTYIAPYFGPNDLSKVKAVFENIWGFSDVGSDNLGTLFWNKNDYGRDCTIPGTELPDVGVTLAYVSPYIIAGHVVMIGHVCPQGYAFPQLSEVKCSNLGDTVNAKMTTLGGIFIHEYTHFEIIGAAGNGGKPVKDFESGYGPLAVRALPRADQLINADNYKWLAQETYWSIICVKTFSGPRDERDTKEPQCGQGKCTIQ